MNEPIGHLVLYLLIYLFIYLIIFIQDIKNNSIRLLYVVLYCVKTNSTFFPYFFYIPVKCPTPFIIIFP